MTPKGVQVQGDGGHLFQALQPVVGLLHAGAPGDGAVVFQRQGPGSPGRRGATLSATPLGAGEGAKGATGTVPSWTTASWSTGLSGDAGGGKGGGHRGWAWTTARTVGFS